MEQEIRKAVFDEKLEIEAYQFKGIMQKFPNHFHEHYVIGFIERGNRHLLCKNKNYDLHAGDLMLMNPKENHTCESSDGQPLDYRCLNIKPEVMKKLVLEITGESYMPQFTQTVIYSSKEVVSIRELHAMIMEKYSEFEKEESFYFLIEYLLKKYTGRAETKNIKVSTEVKKACDYIDKNYDSQISLEDLCNVSGLKKYTLLRNFTKQCGVTPYQYLETIRISHAKKLLQYGIEPIEAAIQTGFSDQSHFTRFFKSFIGITPKQYQIIFKEEEV